ncbi:hypothetical protein HY339_01100 [Candidatus Gottesmanbacteria bacterium]|nr:hypothetical protein [Candidatus Gottesmanbacteria bacterium]
MRLKQKGKLAKLGEALKRKKLLRSRGRQLIIPSLAALEKELSATRPVRAPHE